MKKLILTAALVALATPAFAQTATPGIDAREARQEQRIQQGEASGQLTPREAGRMEARQTKLQQNEARAKADGVVTPKERAKLKREENRNSKAIYNQKHDAQTAR